MYVYSIGTFKSPDLLQIHKKYQLVAQFLRMIEASEAKKYSL